ncbi:uncharacterized protein LOC123014365 isoform X1 [Tribolium madens]|uniref:uncharacterized protein LOC123014365 isoform X1 n=1 Tax=Tribolium madens TaxID=41895 RepID=UPI001CF7481D|nr:uncharacterized protein LOC123014365 isoform X1 [Tribolium madens]
MSNTEVIEIHNSAHKDKKENHRDLWKKLVKETDDLVKEVEEYKRSKTPVLDPPPHPVIDYLNETVFPVLNRGLIKMLEKVKEQESEIFTEGDTYLNSLNFIAEYLWNMNPRHPERKENWTQITNIFGNK